MSTLREQLLAEIETFLKRAKMAETTLGIRALRDPAFVSRLRTGREPKTSTVDKLREFMREHSARRKRATHPSRQLAAAE